MPAIFSSLLEMQQFYWLLPCSSNVFLTLVIKRYMIKRKMENVFTKNMSHTRRICTSTSLAMLNVAVFWIMMKLLSLFRPTGAALVSQHSCAWKKRWCFGVEIFEYVSWSVKVLWLQFVFGHLFPYVGACWQLILCYWKAFFLFSF